MSKDRKESRYLGLGPNLELHYVEKGEGDPIIFIPGLTYSSEIFAAQIERFSRTNRAIAIDPRGQGWSSKTVDGNDYLTHGRDLARLIETLDLKNVVLVGWSTGNLEVWSYIRQFGKSRVKAAVTIDMSPLPLHPDPQVWTEGTIEELSEVASTLLITPEGCHDFFRDYTTGSMLQHTPDDDELEALMDIHSKTPYWVARALFCDAMFSNYVDVAKEISETLPSLMYIAEHWSGVAKPWFEGNFPGTETYVMGGHLMFYEYPERWNGVLESFLAKL